MRHWLCVCLLTACLSSALAASAVRSVPPGLTVTLQAMESPIPLNRMHSWIILLQTDDGEAVTGADITVDGGMPAHDHGLATRPQVTQELGNGRYQLDGVRFHMNGQWLLRVDIRYRQQSFRADVPVSL